MEFVFVASQSHDLAGALARGTAIRLTAPLSVTQARGPLSARWRPHTVSCTDMLPHRKVRRRSRLPAAVSFAAISFMNFVVAKLALVTHRDLAPELPGLIRF